MRRTWAWIAILLGLALSTEAGMLPMDVPEDPKAFLGSWVEYWPGVSVHDSIVVTFQNDVLSVQVTNPKDGPRRVDNVRLEGDVLKFTEYAGNHVIQYEVRIEDGTTLAVTAQGGPPAEGRIVWRRPGEPGPGKDPAGLAGTWVEDWPGVADHDISVVTYQNGQYSVQVTHPWTGPYKVENVRFEGNVLKFTEYPGIKAVHYEVRLQDAKTLAVTVRGGPAAKGHIVWRRQAEPGLGKDPAGFVGTWVEQWPGITAPDSIVVTFQNGAWSVQVSNPRDGPYRVDKVRLEGGVLKFTKYPGTSVIHYQVRVEDAKTLAVAVRGGPAAPSPIVWRRQAEPEPGKDPIGLVGTWVEDWPGVPVHDISVITYRNGRYGVAVTNPEFGQSYTIANIRLEGNVLRFTQHTGDFDIHYAVTLQNANNCAVTVRGGPPARGPIFWRRRQ